MPLPKNFEKLEQDINGELKRSGLNIHFNVKDYDPKTKSLLHNIVYDSISKDKYLKVSEIVGRNYERWKKANLKEF